MKINQLNKYDNNFFTTKAEVLSFLKTKLKNSKIENLFYFTMDEWNNNLLKNCFTLNILSQ